MIEKLDKLKKISVQVLFFALAVPMFYFFRNDIIIGGFGVMYQYLFGVGIIALALLSFLIKPEVKKSVVCLKQSVILSAPYLWTLAYSMLFWVFSLSQMKVITRGFSMIVYQIIAVLVAAATLYLFKQKGIYLLLAAMIASDAIFLFEAILANGFVPVLTEYVELVLSFTAKTGPIMKGFENNGHTYAYGFFLVYFLTHPKENKKYWLLGVITIFFYFLGLKRSGMLAIAVTIFASFVLVRMKSPKGFLKFCCVLLFIFGILYIVLTYFGIFNWLESIGIDTKERASLYELFLPYYDLAIGYPGHGAGFITGSVSSGDLSLITSSGYQLGDIHSDFLRQYIEIGCIGYLIWLWLTLWPRINYFFHRSETETDKKHGIMAAVVILTAFIIYTTENAYYHYYTNVFTMLAIMGYGFEHYTKDDNENV